MRSALGERVYLDTNIIIYALEGFAQFAPQIQPLLEAMDRGEIIAVTSELTLAETLVKPLKEQDHATQQAYRNFLTSAPVFQVIPISRKILEDAAQFQASTKLKLPDAIHLATAFQQQCDSFLTNDEVFRTLNRPQVKMLSEVNWL